MAMQDSTQLVLEQTFAKSHALSLAAADRLQGMMDNVAEQTRLGFLEGKLQVGVREAVAQQRLDSDKLAQSILQQRSAEFQPQIATPANPAPTPGTK